MRKRNREITDINDLLAVIGRCDTCRVAFQTEGAPYIVPMNFGFHYAGGRLTLYFHCATEGHKLELLRRSPLVGFEMDGAHELKTGALACEYSMNFESVIGTGKLYLIEDTEEKLRGLSRLMEHYHGGTDFSPDAVVHTAVLRLEVDEFCGKRLHK